MRVFFSAVLALVSTAALATNPPQPKDPSAEANSTAVGIGVGVGIAEGGKAYAEGGHSVSGAYSESNNANLNSNVAQGGKGGEANATARGGAGGAATADANVGDVNATSEGSNASSDNAVNITSTYKGVRNAPSVAMGSVYPTAGCQGGFGIGGSGVNGSGLLNFSFTKKECETVVLAQNFAAIGMPETSCDILKTTKAWKRAVKANPEIAAACEPQAATTSDTAGPPPPVDTSQFVKRDELEERDRRMIQKFTNK